MADDVTTASADFSQVINELRKATTAWENYYKAQVRHADAARRIIEGETAAASAYSKARTQIEAATKAFESMDSMLLRVSSRTAEIAQVVCYQLVVSHAELGEEEGIGTPRGGAGPGVLDPGSSIRLKRHAARLRRQAGPPV